MAPVDKRGEEPAGAESESSPMLEMHLDDTEPAGVRPLPNPHDPTEEEIAEHEIFHCPYRSGCRFCVMGGGKADPHYRQPDSEEKSVPSVSCDYCYMGEKMETEIMDQTTIPIIVHRFKRDRWITSHPVPRKVRDPWTVKMVSADLEQGGVNEFIYKSDGEPSMKDLKAGAAAKFREVVGDSPKITMEESGVGGSQSNGEVERAIWDVQRVVRTLVFAAEGMHDTKTSMDHPLRLWVIEYAGQILSRCQRSTRDGRSAYELRKGKPYRRKLPAFGEPVLYTKVAPNKRRQKFEDRWETGIYVALIERTNEVRTCTPAGCYKVNNVKAAPGVAALRPRTPEEHRGHPVEADPR